MSVDLHAANPWLVRPLGDVADITLGGTPSTDVAEFWGGTIPWMSSGEVNKKHIFEVDGRITDAGLAGSNATLVDPPAVAIGLAGQGKTRGTAALVHVRVCTNQSIALIKGKNGSLDTPSCSIILTTATKSCDRDRLGAVGRDCRVKFSSKFPLRYPILMSSVASRRCWTRWTMR